jgi:hypothetical protein
MVFYEEGNKGLKDYRHLKKVSTPYSSYIITRPKRKFVAAVIQQRGDSSLVLALKRLEILSSVWNRTRSP